MNSPVTMSLTSKLRLLNLNLLIWVKWRLTFVSWQCALRKRIGTRMWPCPISVWCSRLTPSPRRFPTLRLHWCTRNGLCKKFGSKDCIQEPEPWVLHYFAPSYCAIFNFEPVHWVPDISSTVGPGKNWPYFQNDQGVLIEMTYYFGNKVIFKT